MSDSPPPFDEPKKQNDSDDLFFSTIGDLGSSSSETKQNEDIDELFNIGSSKTKEISASLDATNEIKLDDDEDDDPFSFKSDKKKSNNNSLEQPFALNDTSSSPTKNTINIQPPILTSPTINNSQLNDNASVSSTNLNTNSNNINNNNNNTSSLNSTPSHSNLNKTSSVDEDDEDRDKFIEITLSGPTKVGDGMSSFMTYKVATKTNYPGFKKQEFTTNRRFSDFLSLYEKLKEKHLHNGRFLPPAPEKDMIGTTKVKMSKDESTPNDFIERRKASLERFLNRIGHHQSFKYDPDFRDFLEIQDDLPKATSTSVLSGASMLKMFKNVGETVSKMANKMEETDKYFEEKAHEIENLYIQFRKIHGSLETLHGWRKDLALSTKDFAKSISVLANSEEHISLSRALAQLGEIHEKVEQLNVDQAHSDFYVFTELLKDYIGLLDSIKEAFHQRVKVFQNWQKSKETLKSKQDNKVKLEASNKQDKIPTALQEIKEWESKVEKGKEEFETISKNIKQEMKKFESARVKEFKQTITKYLTNLLDHQQALVKIWEQYLPEVKAI